MAITIFQQDSNYICFITSYTAEYPSSLFSSFSLEHTHKTKIHAFFSVSKMAHSCFVPRLQQTANLSLNLSHSPQKDYTVLHYSALSKRKAAETSIKDKEILTRTKDPVGFIYGRIQVRDNIMANVLHPQYQKGEEREGGLCLLGNVCIHHMR